MTEVLETPEAHVQVLPNTTEPASFTPEQQKFIDEQIIPKVMGRAGREAKEALAAAQTKITDLEVQLRAMNPDASLTDRLQAELATAKAEIASIKTAASESEKASYLNQLAVKHNFVDLELARKIVADRVRRNEDGSYAVLDEKGDVSDKSVEQLMAETAAAKPFLVRGSVVAGTGSASSHSSAAMVTSAIPLSSLFGPKSDGRLANQLALRDKRQYDALRREAVSQNLIGEK